MDGEVIIKTKLDTKSFDAQIVATERKLQNLEDEYELASKKDNFDKNSEGAIRLRKEIEKCTNELIRLRAQQDKLDNNSYDNIKKKLDDIGKNTEKNTKKVAKWALAIFGVRSAYMFVRNAINNLSESDPQLKADIDYIKAALVSVIEPIVRRIVDFVKQLLMYIGYIIKAWTGKNIFENANKNLKGANKQAKELQKTMTGFDEMNVLNKNSSGGGETTTAPSFDLSNIDNMEVPGWIQWIADNREIVIGTIIGIATAIGLIKLGGLIKGITDLGTKLTPIGKWIAKNSKAIAGVTAIAVGLYEVIRGVVQYLKDPTWNNFLTILLGIITTATGVFLLFGGVPALITLIIGLVGALVLVIVKNWNKIVDTLEGVAKWIYNTIIKPIADFFVWLWEVITTGLSIAWDFIKGIFSAFADWVTDNVIKPVADLFTGLWDGIKDTFVKTWDFIIDAFSKGGKIFKGIGEGILNVFKTIVNALIDGINFVISLPFKGINGLLNTIRNAGVLGVYPFKGLWKQDPVPVPKIPKLAKGAIASYPGRGIPTTGGGARWAEAGQEAYLPLTDEQIMSTLGENIGKHVTIHATIINQMGNRTLSRQLKIIKGESDFAFNR
jgi:predicted translin family RNA/ssDNA-binding protein